MLIYQHTQTGTIVRWIFGGAIALNAIILALFYRDEPEFLIIPAVVLAILVVLVFLFGSLTVEVTENAVSIRFGPGLVRKSFPVDKIMAAHVVRNRWYYGWGIRMIPQGWLFNVSGFDAVELRMYMGRIYRIGTDEPDQLLAAVEAARRASVARV